MNDPSRSLRIHCSSSEADAGRERKPRHAHHTQDTHHATHTAVPPRERGGRGTATLEIVYLAGGSSPASDPCWSGCKDEPGTQIWRVASSQARDHGGGGKTRGEKKQPTHNHDAKASSVNQGEGGGGGGFLLMNATQYSRQRSSFPRPGRRKKASLASRRRRSASPSLLRIKMKTCKSAKSSRRIPGKRMCP